MGRQRKNSSKADGNRFDQPERSSELAEWPLELDCMPDEPQFFPVFVREEEEEEGEGLYQSTEGNACADIANIIL